MKQFASVSLALALGLCLAGCQQGAGYGTDAAAPTLTREEIAEQVRSAMDMTVDPCQDFYEYSCGNWMATTKRPSDESRWTRSFSEINIRNREALREIVEEIQTSPDPELAKIGVYYGACMAEAEVEQAGTEPLQQVFDRIATVNDAPSFLEVSAELQSQQIGALLSIAILGDFKNPDMNLTNFFQGGLGLPSRDYYVEADKAELKQQYETHIATMFGLLGDDPMDAQAAAAAIVAFETELALVSRTPAQLRDVEALYHKIDVAGLQELTPSLPWGVFFSGLGYPDIQELNVGTPEFFERLETLLPATAAQTLQSYLRWQYLTSMATRLPAEFVEEDFDFYARTLSGQEENRPRWRRCVNGVEGAMGELLGRAYVEREFPGESKEIALNMIRGIEGAFEGGLPALEWMDPDTRGRALDKMHAIVNKIGYPDKWRDYSDLKVAPGDYFGNSVNANRFEFTYEMDKAGQPVDPTEWGMTPPQVNAYYHPLYNEIVFPAGILQEPFFHRDFPLAMNYGGIGMVMGHELTHGFDDMGRKFDPDGKMEQWWESEAIEAFDERAACIDDLYSNYEVQPDLNINGKLTLGENIADLGGIKESYRAYRDWVAENGEENPLMEELNNDQLFFVSFAQTWCSLSTEESERLRVSNDSHSPGRFRVIGPVSNLPEFAEAFQCEVGTPMNPVERCEVW